MAGKFALSAGDGGDPRLDYGGDPRLDHGTGDVSGYVPPQHRKLHDSNVSFEEYLYYAELTRAEEDEASAKGIDHGQGKTTIMSTIFPKKNDKGVAQREDSNGHEVSEKNYANPNTRHEISEREWTNASRALRTATWGAVFYLITTDILGPFGLPFAFGTTGWGPGSALYTVFGFLAGYSGYLLWEMFLALDSYQFPMRTYGDLAFRIYGRSARHGLNLLQTIQLLCNVGVIVISNGQALSQVSKFRLCYAICCLVWAICGFGIGQIRTLQNYGWLANFAIWINILIIFITMGVAAHSPPNYLGAQAASSGAALGDGSVLPLADGSYPPVHHSAGLPVKGNFIGAVNGLMQAVYAYGGAMLFTEFMSEMKRPRDFLKAMCFATGFIYFFYMLYGLFMYGYQGQYAVNPSYQGISPYNWQTAGNVLAIVSALIAAGLYGNIGVKVLYNNIFMEWFSAPPMNSKKGKMLWAIIIPIYWSIAFIIAAAIPNFFGLTSLVSALCILQFTYTFPPILHIGYAMKKNALQAGEGFDPQTGRVTKHDTGIKRLMRGFMAGRWYQNLFHIVYFLGALVTAGLGAYSAIEALIAAFKNPQVSAFTCHSPLDG